MVERISDKRKLSRRDFLRLAGLTAAGAVLAACVPKEKIPEVEASPEPITENQKLAAKELSEITGSKFTIEHLSVGSYYPETKRRQIWGNYLIAETQTNDEIEAILASIGQAFELQVRLNVKSADGVYPDYGFYRIYTELIRRVAEEPAWGQVTPFIIGEESELTPLALRFSSDEQEKKGLSLGETYLLRVNGLYENNSQLYPLSLVKDGTTGMWNGDVWHIDVAQRIDPSSTE